MKHVLHAVNGDRLIGLVDVEDAFDPQQRFAVNRDQGFDIHDMIAACVNQFGPISQVH